MGRTAKLTISLPEELISFANEIAKKEKISRSKVFSLCLQEMARKRRVLEMEEGYRILAKEQEKLAAIASKIEHEVIPEWR